MNVFIDNRFDVCVLKLTPRYARKLEFRNMPIDHFSSNAKNTVGL